MRTARVAIRPRSVSTAFDAGVAVDDAVTVVPGTIRTVGARARCSRWAQTTASWWTIASSLRTAPATGSPPRRTGRWRSVSSGDRKRLPTPIRWCISTIGAHPLDLVGLVQDPGVAEPVEQDVEPELLAHPVVLRLAGARDVGQLLGQLHRPDPRDVAAGRAAARVAAIEDDDVAHAARHELAGEGEARDPGADDDDVGRSAGAVGRAARCLRPVDGGSSVGGDEVAEADRAERRARGGHGTVVSVLRPGRRTPGGSTCPGTGRSARRSAA